MRHFLDDEQRGNKRMNVKRWVFLILLAVTILVAAAPIIEKRLAKEDLVEEAVLQQGEYKVGEDVPEGSYDVTFSGSSIFQGKEFGRQDEVKAIPFLEGELLYVEGEGKVHLTPARFEKLQLMNGQRYSITHSGFYQVGRQLGAGSYILHFNGDKEKDGAAFAQIFDAEKTVLETYSFQDKAEHTVELEEGTFLQIEKNPLKENNGLEIILEKNG